MPLTETETRLQSPNTDSTNNYRVSSDDDNGEHGTEHTLPKVEYPTKINFNTRTKMKRCERASHGSHNHVSDCDRC
ncbi:hypothetical protein JOB18_037286 [Solea senegalensis]|uniref:Uncharacterized protein n=1 Tax=Solea senegalensis TaxID=28829 RepID=A0AAV6PTR7_SOLSE|nr:hypothetical protein JOB18_037286 [Solea senegalensis]